MQGRSKKYAKPFWGLRSFTSPGRLWKKHSFPVLIVTHKSNGDIQPNCHQMSHGVNKCHGRIEYPLRSAISL